MPRFLPLLILILLLAAPVCAHAHPHEWIDVRSAPVFDAEGRITALKERWLFDRYYTALSLPDFDANENKKFDPPELMALAQGNVSNLAAYNYFTVLEKDGSPISFSGVKNIASRLEDGRILLEFEATLATPMDPRTGRVGYSIFDPSYYIAMLHEEENPVRLDGTVPTGCRYDLAKPKPDSVWVTLAQSLDKSATAPEDLGKYFAERVSITCP